MGPVGERWSGARAGGALLLVLLGSLAGAATSARASRALAPGPVAFWAADRGGDRLLGLDAGLFVREAVTLRAPTRVASAPQGGVYVANAHAGHPRLEHRLRYVLPGGEVRWELEVGPVLDLQSDGRVAVLVEGLAASPGAIGAPSPEPVGAPSLAWAAGRGAGLRVLWVDPAGEPRELVRGPARCASPCADEVLVAFDDGRVQVWSRSGTLLAEADLGYAARAVRPASRGGWWVSLAGPRAGQDLVLLAQDLTPAGGLRSGLGPAVFACAGPDAGVWLAGRTRSVLCRYALPRGRELRVDVPLPGVASAIGLADGGVLLAAPGALLRYDARGVPRPGQGGFGFLVDVAQARFASTEQGGDQRLGVRGRGPQ